MNEQKRAKRQSRLRRLGKELLSAEKQIQEHPLLETKLAILAAATRHYYWQTLWTSARGGGRFLIGLQTALSGSRGTESLSGFFGPSFSRSGDLLETLIEAALKKEEAELAPLYLNLVRILAVGWLYTEAELSGKLDLIPDQREKASFLAQELALIVLMRTRLLNGLVVQLGKGLALDIKSQKIAGEIGLFGILLFLILAEAHAGERAKRFALIGKALLPLCGSVSETLEKLEGSDGAAQATLELLRKACELNDFEAFEEAMEAGFELTELSRENWQQEVVWLRLFAANLRESLLYIFDQHGVRSTSIMQTV